MSHKGLVSEDASGTDLYQVAAELALQSPIFMAAKVHMVMPAKDAEVAAAGIIAIKPDAPIALDAAVHLMIDEGAKILIAVGSLLEAEPAINVAAQQRHVLEMTFTALIAYRTVMRMIFHEPFDDALAKFYGFGVVYRDSSAVSGRSHTGHDDLAASVIFIPEQFDGAQTTRADGMHCWMPAKVWEVESQRKARMEKIQALSDLVRFVIYVNCGQSVISMGNDVP